MQKILFKIFIFIFIIFAINSLDCDGNDLEGCIQCGTGLDSDKCSICENKYFKAFNGEKCIKCNDPNYGMEGCTGSCTLIESAKNVKCQENSCKSGFYEITPGYCSKCSLIVSHCKDCSYLDESGNGQKTFKCLDCDDHYYFDENGLCQYCYLQNCKKCKNEDFCLECKEGYTAYPDGKCYQNIENCKIGAYSNEKNMPICSECNILYFVNSTTQLCQYCTNPIPNVNTKYSCLDCHEEDGIPICDRTYDGFYPDGQWAQKCSSISSQCTKCTSYLDQESGKIIPKCIECYSQYAPNWKYYINSEGKCQNCNIDISRNCYLCSDEENAPCLFCDENAVLINNACIFCNYLYGNNCLKCNDKQCLKCNDGYGFILNETCSKCSELFGEGCTKCGSSIYNLKPFCSYCKYGYTLGIDGKCKSCKNDANLKNCEKCESKGKIGYICIKCESGYELRNGKCIKNCNYGQVAFDDETCKSCNSDEINLNNCERCKKLENNEFICTSCQYEYSIVNGKCKIIDDLEIKNCEEIENFGTEENPIYSCKKCNYVQILKDNGAFICINEDDYPILSNCLRGIKESLGENNYTCTECDEEKSFILSYDEEEKKNICKCKDGYYIYNNYCRKCSEKDSGCINCHLDQYNKLICDSCEKGYVKTSYGQCYSCSYPCLECSFDNEGKEKCDKYKEPYFLSNASKIELCTDYIENCSVCSYINEAKTELKCDKCLDYYFLNKYNVCEKCIVNMKISRACLSCTDDEEIKLNNPCQKCIENYFLTKENNCIFCKSEEYGGINCQECDYDSEENIRCIKCDDPSYILSNEGKCYEPISNCLKYGKYLNNNNEYKFGCISCEKNYEINLFHRCNKIKIKILNCLETNNDNENPKCLSCLEGYELKENKCIDKKPSFDEEIEGCINYEYNYDYYYCINCESGYYLERGYCFQKPVSPYLEKCEHYTTQNGFYECNECTFQQKYEINNHILCKTQIFEDCSELINLGAEFYPRYSCTKCNYALMKDENDIIQCKRESSLNRCVEGKINTNYYKDIYNCTKCKEKYILSYSEFYEKKICKELYEEEKKSYKTIEDYTSDTGIPVNNDGKCENGYFTRNGEVCIKCDDKKFGMPGCDGKCNFKINREYQLLCEENKCKEGYFEILPGQCELCEKTIASCSKCSYIVNDDLSLAMIKPIRQRKLICNECSNNNLFYLNNVCYKCDEIFSECAECINENNNIKCKKAKNGYYINKNGKIKKCENHCNECVLDSDTQKVKCLKINNNKFFINSEGAVKFCSDEYEGIKECQECSF